MDLSQLVYNRLASDETLQKMLAKYDGQPAIFNTEFPSDQQEGWEGKTQYPRIEYQFNMQVDTQRASSGMLMLAIYTEKNPMVAEQLEMCVRRSLKDVLMKPSNEAPFCVAWARTDPFMLEGNAILCKDLVFDILEYPDQETTDPDPVMALSKYIKELYPDCIVLGMDRIGEYTNPADTPIFYCRLHNKTPKKCGAPSPIAPHYINRLLVYFYLILFGCSLFVSLVIFLLCVDVPDIGAICLAAYDILDRLKRSAH